MQSGQEFHSWIAQQPEIGADDAESCTLYEHPHLFGICHWRKRRHAWPGLDFLGGVMTKLQAAGYTNITKLKADDGRWEGKGLRNGVLMEFHVDPRSGALTKEKVED
jgi:hypothetical protein